MSSVRSITHVAGCSAILFVADPFFLHRRFRLWAAARPAVACGWDNRAHWLLLALSALTILSAVAGSQGWFMF